MPERIVTASCTCSETLASPASDNHGGLSLQDGGIIGIVGDGPRAVPNVVLTRSYAWCYDAPCDMKSTDRREGLATENRPPDP